MTPFGPTGPEEYPTDDRSLPGGTLPEAHPPALEAAR